MKIHMIHGVHTEAQAGEKRGNWLRRFSLGLPSRFLAGLLFCVTLLSGTGSATSSRDGNGSASVLATVGAGAQVALEEGTRFVRDLQIIYQSSYLQPLVVEAAAAPVATSAVCKTISTQAGQVVPKTAKSRS